MEVWPDNLAGVNVLIAMGTQLRFSPGSGVSGFDYSALPVVMKLMRLKKKVQARVFDDFRVLEEHAIATIRGGK